MSRPNPAGITALRRATLDQQGELTTSAQLVVIGSDFHRATVPMRERLAFAADRLEPALRELAEIATEAAIVSTCNRVEIYAVIAVDDRAAAIDRVAGWFASAVGVARSDLDRATVALTDEAAVRHLFRVAAGLESMVLGEPQILGQLRDALDGARAAGSTGPILSRLFTEALRVGKLARTQTDIARNKTSIAHAAVALAAREFAAGCPILVALDRMDLTHLPCPSPTAHSYSLRGRTAVVVGAGAMGALAARLLRSGDIGRLLIVNRTRSRADDLAAKTGGEAWPMARLTDALAVADLAIVATGGSDVSIGPDLLRNLTRAQVRPIVMIDVGVPRCVSPDVGADPRVLLRDVDDLEQIAASFRSNQAAQIIHVEHLIAEATRSFQTWLEARQVAPTIAALRDRADAIREQELARALGRLGHLSERDRQVVSALAAGIANKLLHPPTAALKRTDNDQRVADAATMARLFGLTPTVPSPPVAGGPAAGSPCPVHPEALVRSAT